MKLRYYSLLQFVSFISSVLSATANSKRGLVYVSSSDSTLDDRLWTSPTSNLSWYYNYKPRPSPNLISSQLEFVPMLWGASSDSPSSTEFLDDIRLQIRSPGESKIRYILGFNEPDGDHNTGGSNIAPDLAAKTWIRQLEPLRLEDGVKLGGPSVTGSQRGLSWLENFFKACEGRCHIDFLPIHFYGDFQGLASYMGQVRAAYPNTTIWVTEYAKANANLKKSQGFFNTSLEYFDRLDYVERYSYFGSFRSSISNVGPNAAMLTEKGKVTDIGAWYLGMKPEGNQPSGGNRSRHCLFGFWEIWMIYGVVLVLSVLLA